MFMTGFKANRAAVSPRDEMAQPARLLPGPTLQVLITEVGFGAHLGREHIGLLHLEALHPGQGEKTLQIHGIGRIAQPAGQGGLEADLGQEGIELIKAHRGRSGTPHLFS